MAVAVCSLIWNPGAPGTGPQRVAYDSDGYHLVRFPYDPVGESYDPWKMHDAGNGLDEPAGELSTFPDPRSGLIWPSHDGWGTLSAMVFWAADPVPHEYRARFVRDPLGESTGYNSTATCDTSKTGGGQYKNYMWQMFVRPGTPVGLKISARAAGDKRIATPLMFAELKLAIQTEVVIP
ncbi:hypothetical protein [Streptomyces sp. H27-D2]|uniref:hypothetical protein n=1 Tax=Streptomyces sp. H27-D2 TaxID=3046304 RepID=UPI002DB80F7A|nr:hypothetical protein [Streptomyces sp. H27-D2]MEC4019092.1 hypothetical protein [Streptomyces sp. H27-D2]